MKSAGMRESYIVVWAGRGSMPHELRDRERWQIRGSILTDAAMIQTHLCRLPKRARLGITDAEAKRQLAVYASDRIVCATGCGRLVGKVDARTYVRCGPCRTAGRGGVRKDS